MSRSNNFEVILNLSNYYNDHRLITTTIFVGVEIETVEDLQQEISRLLHIENFHLCVRKQFLHPSEDIRIIGEGEILWAIPIKPDDCTDSGGQRIPPGEPGISPQLKDLREASSSKASSLEASSSKASSLEASSSKASSLEASSSKASSLEASSSKASSLEASSSKASSLEASSSKASSLEDSSFVSDEFVTRRKKRNWTTNHPTPSSPSSSSSSSSPSSPPSQSPPHFDEQDSICEEVIERVPSMESMKPKENVTTKVSPPEEKNITTENPTVKVSTPKDADFPTEKHSSTSPSELVLIDLLSPDLCRGNAEIRSPEENNITTENPTVKVSTPKDADFSTEKHSSTSSSELVVIDLLSPDLCRGNAEIRSPEENNITTENPTVKVSTPKGADFPTEKHSSTSPSELVLIDLLSPDLCRGNAEIRSPEENNITTENPTVKVSTPKDADFSTEKHSSTSSSELVVIDLLSPDLCRGNAEIRSPEENNITTENPTVKVSTPKDADFSTEKHSSTSSSELVVIDLLSPDLCKGNAEKRLKNKSKNKATQKEKDIPKKTQNRSEGKTSERKVKKYNDLLLTSEIDSLDQFCVICYKYYEDIKQHIKTNHRIWPRKAYPCKKCKRKLYLDSFKDNHKCIDE